jgi:hypothetical protein
MMIAVGKQTHTSKKREEEKNQWGMRLNSRKKEK